MNTETPLPSANTETAAADTTALPLPSLAAALSEGVQFKRILTTVDFSEASTKGLAYALELATQYGSELRLLHVVEFNYAGSEFGAVELSRMASDMEETAVQQLEAWIAALKSPVKTEGVVKCGRAYAEIVEAAKELPADLIVMASHGHTSLAHVLLGSTVERVVRYAPCPVLVVRSRKA
jgi:nucleotide-binding universal stress UspA family protein